MRTTYLVVIGLFLVVIVAVGLAQTQLSPLNWFARPEATIDASRESVVTQIQSLQRLETSAFTIEKIIEAGVQGNPFQDLLYGDRLLLIAHGTVTAGVDLAQLTQEQVQITDNVLRIQVPAPIIFSTSLDNSKTKVYDREIGLLSSGDKDLESEARLAAQESITQAACEAGILAEAQANTQKVLQRMFELTDYERVEVVVAAGQC